jgi:hypothetical protein
LEENFMASENLMIRLLVMPVLPSTMSLYRPEELNPAFLAKYR